MLYNRRVILYFNDRFLVVRLDFNVWFSTYRISSEIEWFNCLARNGNTLLSHMLITEPFPSVETLILVSSNEIKTLFQWFSTFWTFLFVFIWSFHLRFQSERKDFELVFKLLFKQNLRILLMFSFILIPLRKVIDWLFVLLFTSH